MLPITLIWIQQCKNLWAQKLLSNRVGCNKFWARYLITCCSSGKLADINLLLWSKWNGWFEDLCHLLIFFQSPLCVISQLLLCIIPHSSRCLWFWIPLWTPMQQNYFFTALKSKFQYVYPLTVWDIRKCEKPKKYSTHVDVFNFRGIRERGFTKLIKKHLSHIAVVVERFYPGRRFYDDDKI